MLWGSVNGFGEPATDFMLGAADLASLQHGCEGTGRKRTQRVLGILVCAGIAIRACNTHELAHGICCEACVLWGRATCMR